MKNEDKDDIDAYRKVEKDIENLQLCRSEEKAFGGDVVRINSTYKGGSDDSQELSDDDFRSFRNDDDDDQSDSDDFADTLSNSRSDSRSFGGSSSRAGSSRTARSYEKYLDEEKTPPSVRGRARSRDCLDEIGSASAKSKSASSEPFHLMRYKSSPEDSVAPIIRSACKIICFS